jgi:protein-S-isoprenylcysteine O-methyltransferase Ste14
MHSRLVSIALVAIQFAMLGALAASGPWLARNPFWLAVQFVGVGTGVWAVATMRPGNFHITPDVKHDAQLVRRGPYRWVRHPMYLGLLLVTLPVVVAAFSVWRLAFWLTLLVDLLVKLRYEEGLLVQKFPLYARYQTESKRLIPYVY